jgi:hypothetical protein
MAIINDPDQLRRSSAAIGGVETGEVFFNTTNKTIQLITTSDFVSSNLVAADGVVLQTLYSFIKEQWKSQTDLIKYPFPMEAITSEQFEFINGWKLDTDLSRGYIRNGGWVEKTAAGGIGREYMGVITLGNIEATHTAYYAFAGNAAKTDFIYPGPVNQAVQIFGDTAVDATSPYNGNRRTTAFTVYIRSAPEGTEGVNLVGYTYDQTSTSDIGAGSGVTYQVYRFPLTEGVDINITKSDTTVQAGAYANISYTYLSGTDSVAVGGSSYNFSGVKIDANVSNSGSNGLTTEIYMRTQYLLRQSANIGTSSISGYLADPLVEFVGATLKTMRQSNNEGVYIADYNLSDINNLVFVDDLGEERKFPFYATINLRFGSNLIADANSKYWLFYTSVPSGAFGTANAVYVQNISNTNITGDIHYLSFTPATGSASGTGSGSINTSTFTVSGAGWTVSNLVGQVLNVTSGVNAKKYFITANTATTITTDIPFEATDASMTFTLQQKNTGGLYQFSYDYDGDTDGGRTGGTDTGVTLVAIGLKNAQYATATATITKSSNIDITVTAPLERNYLDPV